MMLIKFRHLSLFFLLSFFSFLFVVNAQTSVVDDDFGRTEFGTEFTSFGTSVIDDDFMTSLFDDDFTVTFSTDSGTNLKIENTMIYITIGNILLTYLYFKN
eukprot:TRINITY_DN13438_c0_g1_i1.p1 TRINITY_DN13438_c0_g1~~TRINITY_DN13438_c0_g1_i1.p1  ORF type:complete len:101 (+),score=20.45 TRINITY_DN13438_c0_g1_i1:35-337(+)